MSDGRESSLDRVERAAREAGLAIDIRIMAQSTRTAAEAAEACECSVGQIVKSLVFTQVDDDILVLLLVAGDHNVDLAYVSERYGLVLKRADIDRVRRETGFAIGGVAPIGHAAPLRTFMDEALLRHDRVFAAAGRPDAVFAVAPEDLLRVTASTPISVGRNV
jgi:prolyl-tRNA editing enzyme YbaK/EbsC (Cys-tRNA(Pro) deacylase)